MSAGLLFSFVIGYFILLLIVAWYTSRNSNNDSFFIGNRNSNWMLVAFGMIGTSLSGVTFVSVPGGVGKESLLELREVYQATTSKRTKYPMTNENNKPADIVMLLLSIGF